MAAARDVSSMRLPAKPSSAGSSVMAANIITNTLIAPADRQAAHERPAR